jgi:hypothetical protein
VSSTGLPALRRLVLRTVVGSFSFAALLGVVALLAPGHFSGLQGRVLLTTLIVGVTSVLTLCYVAVGGRYGRWVGAAGEAAALVAATSVLLIVWAFWQRDPGPGLSRTFGVSVVLALTLAQFSLLVAVARRPGPVARLLAATLVAGTALAGLLVASVLGWSPNEVAARGYGVVAILDVLGTVVTIALGVFGHEDRSLTVTLSPGVAAGLRDASAETGRPVRDLVEEAVGDRYHARSGTGRATS